MAASRSFAADHSSAALHENPNPTAGLALSVRCTSSTRCCPSTTACSARRPFSTCSASTRSGGAGRFRRGGAGRARRDLGVAAQGFTSVTNLDYEHIFPNNRCWSRTPSCC